MDSITFTYLTVSSFTASFFITLFLTPRIAKFAYSRGAVDIPTDNRRMHTHAVPRLGGLAIVSGVLIPLIFLAINSSVDSKYTLGVIVAVFIMGVGAYIDDVKTIPPSTKLIFQFFSASAVYLFGIRISQIALPSVGAVELSVVASYMITVIWIMGVSNAVNFIDGLDGLAVGLGAISAFSLLIIFGSTTDVFSILLSGILIAALCGFWPYNFKPASIFMGETGSSFLGLILAILSIRCLSAYHTSSMLFIPILILFIPIVDITFAIIRRIRSGVPITVGDKGHVHHRLVALTNSSTISVFILYAVSILLASTAIGMTVLLK